MFRRWSRLAESNLSSSSRCTAMLSISTRVGTQASSTWQRRIQLICSWYLVVLAGLPSPREGMITTSSDIKGTPVKLGRMYKSIVIADRQKMAVAEWLQSFNSVRGPMERLGTM